MASEDIRQINRHLDVLHKELIDLTEAIEGTNSLEREATTQELLAHLIPTLNVLGDLEARIESVEPTHLAETLTAALPRLGLIPVGSPGSVLDLWPEEASEDFVLDSDVPPDAMMIRVEIIARGWRRGKKIIARPRGRVLEVIHDEEDEMESMG